MANAAPWILAALQALILLVLGWIKSDMTELRRDFTAHLLDHAAKRLPDSARG